VVNDPSGCAHDDVDPAVKGVELCFHGRTAVHRQDADVYVHAQPLDLLGDLDGELAGRAQDQRRRELAVLYALDQRNAEGGGLAGAGLGLGDDIAALQQQGYGSDLHWGRFGPAHLLNGL
jgi:hypothetical protein